jgi:DNA-binding NtrC family response regulator
VSARVLAVDDDPAALATVRDALAGRHAVETCSTVEQAMHALGEREFDLVLTDLDMPAPDGFVLLEFLRARDDAPPVAVLSGVDTARATLRALGLGAFDYLLKPVCPHALMGLVDRFESQDAGESFGLIGVSDPIRRLRRVIPLLARSRESVLIVGETGTGKELLARAVHQYGGRSGGPFVAHNLAATPPDLGESLFFGHVRGAFSGAHADHAGLFEQARGGTLLLDEVDSAPLPLQAKLLRVLETGVLQRVGDRDERPIDVRVMAASAGDPAELVARGLFRADLYYRLRQLEAFLPPLRERPEDVPELVRHILAQWRNETGGRASVHRDALDVLQTYDWPGNVRELRHALRAAALLAGDGPVGIEHLPRALIDRASRARTTSPRSLDSVEHEHIRRTLERAAGNQSLAARWLGIDRGTLARKLRRLGLS